jgi:hypothetical protein
VDPESDGPNQTDRADQKTSTRNVSAELFDLLGYTFGLQCWWGNGRRILAATHLKKRRSVFE